MSNSTYELIDKGDRWAAICDGDTEFASWDREADPLKPAPMGLLNQLSNVVEARWGRRPNWVPITGGWRAT